MPFSLLFPANIWYNRIYRFWKGGPPGEKMAFSLPRLLRIGDGGSLWPGGGVPVGGGPVLLFNSHAVPPAGVRQLFHRPVSPGSGAFSHHTGSAAPGGRTDHSVRLSLLCGGHPVPRPAAGQSLYHFSFRLRGTSHPAAHHGPALRAGSGPPLPPPGRQRDFVPALFAHSLSLCGGHLHRRLVFYPPSVPPARLYRPAAPPGGSVQAMGVASLPAPFLLCHAAGAHRLPHRHPSPPSPSYWRWRISMAGWGCPGRRRPCPTF